MTNLRGSIATRILSTGVTIELWEPPGSGTQAGLRPALCPRCKITLGGFAGRYAAIRAYNTDGALEWVSGVTSNYGHYDCIVKVYDDIITEDNKNVSVPVPNDLESILWTHGTQRDMINALQRMESPKQMVVEYDHFALRSRRYKWRIVGDM